MPFFPQAYLSPEPTLFHLLSALDAQSPQKSPGCGPRRHHTQTYTPRFDVTETLDAYELYGEVPGLTNDGLTIEFTDAQTLVIKGKTERRPSPESTEKTTTTTEVPQETEITSEHSHNATVEDDYDEADTPLTTPASTSTLTAEEKGKQPETTPAATAEEDVVRPKYWIAERRTGEFARSFTFEQRVEQDFVTAGLKNGILHVVVPKNLRRGKVVVSVN